MNSKLWIRKALSTCLVVATIAAYSMVTLASSEKIAGEISVSGKTVDGQSASVKVNGETAQSGRSIFSASTIATPDNASVVVNLGKAGKIELAPNSAMSLSFDENSISGDLSAGRITVLNASSIVNIKTTNGEVVSLNAGESADAAGAQTQTSASNGGGHGLIIFAIILGGAAAGLIIASTTDNNRISLGGGTTVVSTTR